MLGIIMNRIMSGILFVSLFTSWSVLGGEVVTGDWSQEKDFLKARLRLEYPIKENVNQLGIHVELANTCPPEGTIWVKFPLDVTKDLSISVKDGSKNTPQRGGNDILPRPLFCSTIMGPPTVHMELPQDSFMSFSIAANGGGVRQDSVLVYLTTTNFAWYLPVGTTNDYYIGATLRHSSTNPYIHQEWRGTLEIPSVKIPLGQVNQSSNPAAGDSSPPDGKR